MTLAARYRLVAVDGEPLPVALPYDTQRCVVAAGTLVLGPPDAMVAALSDGRITWTSRA